MGRESILALVKERGRRTRRQSSKNDKEEVESECARSCHGDGLLGMSVGLDDPDEVDDPMLEPIDEVTVDEVIATGISLQGVQSGVSPLMKCIGLYSVLLLWCYTGRSFCLFVSISERAHLPHILSIMSRQVDKGIIYHKSYPNL
jgi:hypothetical protein